MESPIAVTISRQFGAGGSVIARQVAQRLGFQYLDREILGHVARKVHEERQALAGREERLSSLWEMFLQVFSLGTPESAYPQPETCRYFSDRELFQLEGEVIREVAARQSAVIVGRGGFKVLAEHPGLISIFLHADRPLRAAAIRRRLDLENDREALELIDERDRQLVRYLKVMTEVDWLVAPNFHLCLDTGRFGEETAVEMIVQLVGDVRKRMMR